MLRCCYMPSTLLIPGYAVGVHASIFRKPFGEHGGFVGLDAEVMRGEAKAFRWCKNISLSMLQSANPWHYYQLYRDEEALAESSATQSALYNFITAENPSTIICHSLGCRLMIGAMNTYGIPESISKIIFLQGDVPTSASVTNTAVLDRFANKTLTIENYHCPWDQSLLASMMLHRKIRIGLTGWKQIGVKNVFHPLLKPMNLHTSPLRDRKFAKKLHETLDN